MTDKQDHIRSVFLRRNTRKLVKEFADENGMSVSEVITEAMDAFESGDYPVRKTILERVTIWIRPERYTAFTNKARKSKLTIREALEIALERRMQ